MSSISGQLAKLRNFASFALLVALAGCAATGIQMTDEEAAACKVETCTVWTTRELLRLADEVFTEGFKRGAQQKKERSL